MFSHLCLLLSLIFTTKANNVFFLFATKPHKCTTVERLFPALQQSALPLVFHENSEVSTLDSKGTEKNTLALDVIVKKLTPGHCTKNFTPVLP